QPDKTERLPLEAIVHNEVYQQYSDKDIKDLYAEKELLPSNQKFVAENNKETLAQVFTDIRYKKADNEHFSNVLLSVLKQQGFM
ncbi:MAG TPA: NADPH-dependent oxidoreductase, partial [Prolixibacteraceae bacterium]|nr:NADPH-dependent oxidoreductase [Prolixibacteraceae bacterium]